MDARTLRHELRTHARAILTLTSPDALDRDQVRRQIVATALLAEPEHPSSVAYRALEELVDIALAEEEILLSLDGIT